MTTESQHKLEHYRAADAPLPAVNRLWPLYGAGWESLGKDGASLEAPLSHPGPDELLVRHDAVGICFSDIKVLRAGEKHPRIYRNMQEKPVVLGHEVALTVVEVGANLRDQYQPGDRFIVQADIYINGKSYAYGYEIEGASSATTSWISVCSTATTATTCSPSSPRRAMPRWRCASRGPVSRRRTPWTTAPAGRMAAWFGWSGTAPVCSWAWPRPGGRAKSCWKQRTLHLRSGCEHGRRRRGSKCPTR